MEETVSSSEDIAYAITCKFQTPFVCRDVAVTSDGHVLLAASAHGLLEYSEQGQKLSNWKATPKPDDGQDDEVWTVSALNGSPVADAAVGFLRARLVVLLARDAASDGEWRVINFLDSELLTPAWSLSAHADLIAVAECRYYEPWRQWQPGSSVVVARLSSRGVLCRQAREYDVQSVAVTAAMLITASRDPVPFSPPPHDDCDGSTVAIGRPAHIVEARTHGGDHCLWKRAIGDEEEVWDVCATPTGSVIYVTLLASDWIAGRVAAVRACDGAERARSVCCCCIDDESGGGLQRPGRLSVIEKFRRMLALLSWDGRTVTVFADATGGSLG